MKPHRWRAPAALLLFLGIGMPAPAQEVRGQVPAELIPYTGAHSVIEKSPEELKALFPELKKNFSFTEDQSLLPEILEKVGKNVKDFFRYFPNTASVENVIQDVLDTKEDLIGRVRSKYNYLMTTRQHGTFGLKEYRTDPEGKDTDQEGPMQGFMESSLCAWHLVHFHPLFQSDSRYRYLGRSSSPEAYLIGFAQKTSAREVEQVGLWAPDVPDHKVVLLLQGVIWVDPEKYQIVRAHTELLAPLYDVGLTRDSTKIECREIRFDGVERTFWLPREVTVTTTFRSYTYRNRHRYSDYQLFTVEARDKITPPTPP